MLISILLGFLIFSYASYGLYRHIQQSKKGRCAACSLQKACEQKCEALNKNN
ncbi:MULTISPECIES: FeoB-associated Cys-rich membrane protein [Bacillaceae]|uniref:FeoB-associated Cys-rich membrane protein n=1 Tax=Niallia hominis TaxID=3133173 RepID=A0ABV1EVF9_9BACI|nr:MULTISPECIES: FeoB-associated Cys-rich membrane protein [unclassified Bacillus (in: firmicutes)]